MGRKFEAPPLAALSLGLALTACATGGRATRPEIAATAPSAPSFALSPARFSDLPGWAEADLAPALGALRRSCAVLRNRAPGDPIGANARYGGTAADWIAACAGADQTQPGGERAFFEMYFTPQAIVSEGGQARLTGYYEPIVQVSRMQTPLMSEALRPRPNDMIIVDLAAFAEAYDDANLRGAPRTLTGKMDGSRVRPYPARSEITAMSGPAFAYAHPVDVYNLQVQGSGRIQFPDGAQERAAFAAQNGYRWRSAIGQAQQAGRLPRGSATWRGFRAYIDGLSREEARAALNLDPSYVFFTEEQIIDPNLGPRGAQGVNLTPLGSIAVDPAFHPYGALLFVDGMMGDGAFRRLLVAQDTGGAIRRGPLRGDVFFGSGPDAGAQAERMNAPARFWTLTPRGAPIALADLQSIHAR